MTLIEINSTLGTPLFVYYANLCIHLQFIMDHAINNALILMLAGVDVNNLL